MPPAPPGSGAARGGRCRAGRQRPGACRRFSALPYRRHSSGPSLVVHDPASARAYVYASPSASSITQHRDSAASSRGLLTAATRIPRPPTKRLQRLAAGGNHDVVAPIVERQEILDDKCTEVEIDHNSIQLLGAQQTLADQHDKQM